MRDKTERVRKEGNCFGIEPAVAGSNFARRRNRGEVEATIGAPTGSSRFFKRDSTAILQATKTGVAAWKHSNGGSSAANCEGHPCARRSSYGHCS